MEPLPGVGPVEAGLASGNLYLVRTAVSISSISAGVGSDGSFQVTEYGLPPISNVMFLGIVS